MTEGDEGNGPIRSKPRGAAKASLTALADIDAEEVPSVPLKDFASSTQTFLRVGEICMTLLKLLS